MASDSASEVAHDFSPFFKVYKDGRIERFKFTTEPSVVPPGTDPSTGIQSKDVVISSETGISVRIFLPKVDEPGPKLPLLVHYHGGAFCLGSPFGGAMYKFLTRMVSLANVVCISVDYRLAPENPLPTAHEDAFEALKWIAGHGGGQGPEPWIHQYVDLDRVFLTGESAGANIAHYVAVKAGATNLTGLKIIGSMMVHPFFGGNTRDKMIKYLYPTSSGTDSDPILSPAADPHLSEMAGERVLVCVAQKDPLKDRGVKYYETLCGAWKGKAEMVEAVDEDHCFYLFKNNEEGERLLKSLADFIKQAPKSL